MARTSGSGAGRELSLGQLRSWLFTIPVAVLITALMVTTAILGPPGRFQRMWYRAWARAVLFVVGARVRVRGIEQLDPNAHFVFVSNHASLMDTAVMFGYLPVDFKFLAKHELLKVPFIGWYLRRGGHLTVSRGSIRSSIESMNEAARLIRERNLSVLIFAEGTRSEDGQLQPFKDGAAYLAIQSGVPCAPVGLHGTWNVLPARSSYFRGADVEIRFGRPQPVTGLTLKDRGALTRDLENSVRELLASS